MINCAKCGKPVEGVELPDLSDLPREKRDKVTVSHLTCPDEIQARDFIITMRVRENVEDAEDLAGFAVHSSGFTLAEALTTAGEDMSASWVRMLEFAHLADSQQDQATTDDDDDGT